VGDSDEALVEKKKAKKDFSFSALGDREGG